MISAPVTVDEDVEANVAPTPTPSPLPVAPPPSEIPRIGLILGPGGARTFAHIGALHELQREKIPLVAVGGIEWGSLVAAYFSNKGFANEAEWQMQKLKADDVVKKSLIGGSTTAEVSALSDFLKLSLSRLKAEDAKIPFSCPAQNLSKNQVFLMSRGSFEQMLPYCIAYPPLFRPWQGNVAGVREVKQLADQLRARGARIIVLLNVLPNPNLNSNWAGEKGSTESVLWNEIAAFYSRPLAGVDHVVNIPLGEQGLMSFDDRREIQQKGAEKSSPLLKQLARRLGL